MAATVIIQGTDIIIFGLWAGVIGWLFGRAR